MEYERGRKDGVPSNVGPKPTFTGHAMQDTLLDDGERGEVRVYGVIFEPGARTYWHSHAAGQTLLVNSGEGMVETRHGDRRVGHRLARRRCAAAFAREPVGRTSPRVHRRRARLGCQRRRV